MELHGCGADHGGKRPAQSNQLIIGEWVRVVFQAGQNCGHSGDVLRRERAMRYVVHVSQSASKRANRDLEQQEKRYDESTDT